MKPPITPAGFESLFRSDEDPWNYRGSGFEAFKRTVLLRACGDHIHGRTLELACANGETTLQLAQRSLRLLAVDASPAALKVARRRAGDRGRIRFDLALLPGEMPHGAFDLIVASEIIYYLGRRAAEVLVRRMRAGLARGGRIVVLHHLCSFDDASQVPRRAHANLCRQLAATMSLVFHERHRRFDCAAFTTGEPSQADRNRPRC